MPGERRRHRPERGIAVEIAETHPLRDGRPGNFLRRGDDRHHRGRDQRREAQDMNGSVDSGAGEHQRNCTPPSPASQDQHVDAASS